jgi:universal stress protein E
METYLIIAGNKGEKESAIHRGIELAKVSGAAVHIVGFAFDTYVSEQTDQQIIDNFQLAMIAKRQEYISNTIEKIDIQNVMITTDVVWEKDISKWIVDHAKSDLHSMIIKTGNRSEKFNYTPSDWKIFRESPIPVMIVAKQKWRQKENVLCPLNLGLNKDSNHQLNRQIIKQGKVLAKLLNSQLYFCYAIPVPNILIDLDVVNKKKIVKEKTQKAHLEFAKFADEFGLDPSMLHTKAGEPEKVIPSIANKLKTRMVVIGTLGRKGIKGKLIGNTAEKVLHHLRTDLLTVSPTHDSD